MIIGNLNRPDIVAHDFGGSSALRAHLLDGSEYRSLMLIDPVAISPQGSPLVRAAKQHQRGVLRLTGHTDRRARSPGSPTGGSLTIIRLRILRHEFVEAPAVKEFPQNVV
jgi:hypothetical protein